MTLRKLTSQDLHVYKHMRLLSLETDPNAFFLQLSWAKNYPDSFFLSEILDGNSGIFGFYGAFDEEKLIGMISLQAFEKGKAQIFTLYVNPEYRGKGIGTSLTKHVIHEASLTQITSLRLTVIAGNTVIPLYESLGFQLMATNKAALRNSNGVFDELVYQKEFDLF